MRNTVAAEVLKKCCSSIEYLRYQRLRMTSMKKTITAFAVSLVMICTANLFADEQDSSATSQASRELLADADAVRRRFNGSLQPQYGDVTCASRLIV